ncbi:hypothetical protein GCM10028771_24360 [Nocardioides marmoraquaticus]
MIPAQLGARVDTAGWAVKLGSANSAWALLLASRREVNSQKEGDAIWVRPETLDPIDLIDGSERLASLTRQWRILESNYARRNYGSLADLELTVTPA